MKKKAKRKLIFLTVDALLAATLIICFSKADNNTEEIIDDAPCE